MRDSFYPLIPFLLPRSYSVSYHLYSVPYPNPQSQHLSNLHYHHPHPLVSSTPSQIHSLLLFLFSLNFTLFTFIKKEIHNLLHRGQSINLQLFIESTRDLPLKEATATSILQEEDSLISLASLKPLPTWR